MTVNRRKITTPRYTFFPGFSVYHYNHQSSCFNNATLENQHVSSSQAFLSKYFAGDKQQDRS